MGNVLSKTGALTSFAAALLLGCGSSGSSSTQGATDATGSGGAHSSSSSASGSSTGGSGGGSSDVPCDGAPEALSLSGTWAAHGQLAVSLQGVPGGAITICPADQVGASNLIMLMSIEQNAADPTKLDKIAVTLCSLDLPVVTALVGSCDPTSQALVSTQIIAPASFIDALPKIQNTAVTGTLGGTAPGSAVGFGQFDLTVGASKSGADLPLWDTESNPCKSGSVGRTKTCEATCVSDCSGLRDDDADGYPGATVDVCGFTPDDTKKGVMCHADTPNDPGSTLQGRAFLDIEVTPKFDGTAKSSCELEGLVDAKVVYDVVGADIYLAGAPIPVTSAIKSLPQFEVVKAQSKLRMVRVDGQYGSPDFKLDPTNPSAACKIVNMNVNQL